MANGSTLNRGDHTLAVQMELFSINRKRLVEALSGVGDLWNNNSAVFFQGGTHKGRYSTDAEPNAFRQESNFFWAFGVVDSDCYGAITKNGKSLLFVPKLPDAYKIWMGRIPSLEEIKNKYKVDEVYYVEDLVAKLGEHNITRLLGFHGPNTDSDETYPMPTFDGIDKFELDSDSLYPILCELRVIKTVLELQVLKYAADATCRAHKELMSIVKPGQYEYQLESNFLYNTSFHAGCRHAGYTCISGSGANAAILHYGHAGAPNSKGIQSNDICLCDMGAEYFCYTADVTTSFPANGVFSDKMRKVYQAVLNANRAVIEALKPGVDWTDMHLLAERHILTVLRDDAGIIIGDIEEMLKARLGAIFQPHGLGHFIGLDVHDVGGYLPGHPVRSTEPGLKSLRTRRIMKENMYITVEPGCYFIDALLDQALSDPKLAQFLVKDKLEEYRNIGGVRIEDDVQITSNGCINYSADLPRTIAEIEDFMAMHNPNIRK